jgi:RNA polymerase sigma-70 factor (ECF subfamily)
MEPSISVAGLAERIRLGEKPAEEALVEFFYPRVYAMALVRTRDREVARDLAQETLLAVLCALREGRLRDKSGLAGYVCATARNRVSYFFRRRSNEVVAERAADPVLDRMNPEKSFEETERRTLALAAIERLSARDQKILRLTLVEGLKPGEIAAKLGLDAGVVRKRKSRAVRRAREVMRRRLSRTKA